MNAIPTLDFAEVTRLTRTGRLTEATALLQGLLGGLRPASSPAEGTGTGASAPTAADPTLIEMTPPSPESGGAWTAALAREPTGVASGKARARLAERLGEMLGGLGRLDPAAGFQGLARPSPAHPAAPLPDGARFEERSFADAAGSRTYKLYVPSSSKGEGAPLLVMLHGCTQSPDDFAAGTRMNELAEEHGLLVAYPAQAQSANPSKCWNWFQGGHQLRDTGEPALIAGITRAVMREFGVDPGRVYIAGLSAGGAAAAIMAEAYPDLYAAVGVHSGLACGAASDLPSALAAMRQGGSPGPGRRAPRGGTRPVPTIVFHGDQDKTVHPANGAQVIARSKGDTDLATSLSNGRAPGGGAYTRAVHTDTSGAPVLEHWTLHGAGHAWSGGSPAGSYTDPAGPDASREMLRFFLAHAKSPA